ncbi:MAG: DUF2059 domain-containing protein [Thaumarchaeota archaeon]|nr:DUF2059 domain-containing protein [Nitrososphaerota archaeon]
MIAFNEIDDVEAYKWKLQKTTATIEECRTKATKISTQLLENFFADISVYESESGQSMLKKMPAVMKDSMQIGQQMVMSIIPKMNAMREEFKNELKLARNETTSSKE